MLYSEYISLAKSVCIGVNDETDEAYLMPDYRYILSLANLKLSDVTDFPDATMEVVSENLQLEVKLYNQMRNRTKVLADQAYEFITTAYSMTETQEQNDLIKNVLGYMKEKNQEHEKKIQAAPQEKAEIPENVSNLIQTMNFSKKELR